MRAGSELIATFHYILYLVYVFMLSAAHLDVFFVVWDSGEELLPSHQLSKHLRSFLQTFDEWFDVVVHGLPVNLHTHTHTHVHTALCGNTVNKSHHTVITNLLDVLCGQPV